jgi:sugar phosphate isomerase/epimerase
VRFGYSTNAFVKFSLMESVEKIARLGFGGVEIMCDQPHLYPPEFGNDALVRLEEVLQAWDLKVTNLNSFTLFAVGDTHLPSWIEPEKEGRDIRIRHTLECLKVADRLGCRNISVPPGGPPNRLPRAKALALFYRGLEQVIPLAEALKVKILVEPEPDLLIENSRQFKSFITEVASAAVGLNFDMGHFFCVGEDPAEAFEELYPWVGHVHLEDIAASRVHRHLIAGEGTLAFPEVFRTMSRLGYQGDISLELYPYTDRPEAAGKASLRYLVPLFEQAGLVMEVPSRPAGA